MTFPVGQDMGCDAQDADRPATDPTHAIDLRSRLGLARLRLGYRWLLGILVLFLAVYLASGFYVVGADERAVVRRFGAVDGRVGPGMHYCLPWPVDRVDVVKTTTVMKVGVGFALSTGADLLLNKKPEERAR